MIKQGAKLVESIDDILEELYGFSPLLQNHKTKPKRDLSLIEQQILSRIGHEIMSLDVLQSCISLQAKEISAILLKLELDGFIQSVYGGYQSLA